MRVRGNYLVWLLSVLPAPPEPAEIKEFIKGLMNAGISPKYAVWLGNRVAKYLWGYWGGALKASGLRWPDFLRLLSGFEDDLIAWASGKLSWDEFIGRVAPAVSGEAGIKSSGGLLRWVKK